jgi:hypothetical protein
VTPDSKFLTRDVFALIRREKHGSFSDSFCMLSTAWFSGAQQLRGLFGAGNGEVRWIQQVNVSIGKFSF